MMSASPKTELVDFHGLSGNGSRARLLVQNLGSLLVMTAGDCSDEHLEIYDGVLLRLADMVEEEVRTGLAEKLADLSRAPVGIVRQLASDNIGVARPILTRSPVLDEIDLRFVCQSLGDDHMMAVSERESLPESVSDVIVERGSTSVLVRLAGNAGAQISKEAFGTLVRRAADAEDLQDQLSGRADFPADLIRDLVSVATERVRDRLADSGRTEDAIRVADAMPLATARIVNTAAADHYDFAGAEAEIREMAAQGELTQRILADAADRDSFPEVVWAYAIIAGLPFKTALSHLTAASPGQFLLAAAAERFEDATVVSMMHCGPWRSLLSNAGRDHAIRQLRRMNPATAAKIVDTWRPARTA